MRAGSLPLLAWAALLLVSTTGCAIVTRDRIQVAEFVGAVLILLAFAGWFTTGHREMVRRGEPGPGPEREAVPEGSLASVGLGLGFATVLFGLVWADFLVGFGAGVMLLSAGRLFLELRAQAASVRSVP